MSIADGTLNSAPDTPSPVYPDRLIRPLPKRTLRSRLSTEAADNIFYPPAPPATQLFYGACADNGSADDSKVYVQQTFDSDVDPNGELDDSYENGVEFESGDEDGPVVVRRSAGFRGSPLSPSASTTAQGYPSSVEGSQIKSPAGPDGYDAFENTNNKKKRKIPTPGSLGGHHSALSPEFATMGLASSTPPPATANDGSSVGTYYGTGHPASPVGNGISGSGRGRLGRASRSGSGRPLSMSGWANCRPSRRDVVSSTGTSLSFCQVR